MLAILFVQAKNELPSLWRKQYSWGGNNEAKADGWLNEKYFSVPFIWIQSSTFFQYNMSHQAIRMMVLVVVSLKFLLSIFLSHRQIVSWFFRTLNVGQKVTWSNAPFPILLFCLSLCYVIDNKGREFCLFCVGFGFCRGFVCLFCFCFCFLGMKTNVFSYCEMEVKVTMR